jgi:folate-dependent phosphoribosylglycinamide formyltransferase PurN
MKVVIFTQNDMFFIPKNVKKIIDLEEVQEIIIIDSEKGSLINKKYQFYKWFGLFECAKMGAVFLFYKIMNFIDPLFGFNIIKSIGSLENLARKENIAFKVIKDVNSNDFVKHIESLKPDLIISFSVPQIIKEPLLSIPKYGVINLHCSYLPYYRGLFPSFWVLYNEEKMSGATVHYMDNKIDNGPIIVQEKISIEDCKSIFLVNKKTKKLGGELILYAIKCIKENKLNLKENNISKGSYYSWPTELKAKEFRMKGFKLI